jgi:hypothetical protein
LKKKYKEFFTRVKQVYIWLNDFIENKLKSDKTDLNAILNSFDYDVIDNNDKMFLIRMESYLKLFIDLLPKFNFDENWYNVDINDQVRGYLKKLEAKFHDKVKDFDKTCRIFFNDCHNEHFGFIFFLTFYVDRTIWVHFYKRNKIINSRLKIK